MQVLFGTLTYLDIERKFGFVKREDGERVYANFFALRAVAQGAAGPYFEQPHRLQPEMPKVGDLIAFIPEEGNPLRARRWGSGLEWDAIVGMMEDEARAERQKLALAEVKKFAKDLPPGPIARPKVPRQAPVNFYRKEPEGAPQQ